MSTALSTGRLRKIQRNVYGEFTQVTPALFPEKDGGGRADSQRVDCIAFKFHDDERHFSLPTH